MDYNDKKKFFGHSALRGFAEEGFKENNKILDDSKVQDLPPQESETKFHQGVKIDNDLDPIDFLLDPLLQDRPLEKTGVYDAKLEILSATEEVLQAIEDQTALETYPDMLPENTAINQAFASFQERNAPLRKLSPGREALGGPLQNEGTIMSNSNLIENNLEVPDMSKVTELQENKTPDLAKKRLGRGLASLIGLEELRVVQGAPSPPEARSAGEQPSNSMAVENLLPIKNIHKNPYNPRRNFEVKELEELSASIKEHGVIQPILVRPIEEGSSTYQIVAGERRWRAAQEAGLEFIPAIIRNLNDKKALELALIENIQRFDLNPLEEALGYKQLIEEFHYTQEELGKILGKSRSYIANSLRLLKLPLEVQNLLEEGNLTIGHGRALINAPESTLLAQMIVAQGLSVRETEALVQEQLEHNQKDVLHKAPLISKTLQEKQSKTTDKERISYIAHELNERLAFNVLIKHNTNKDKGVLKIEYNSLSELETIYEYLKK